jgi:hypothetical protein
VRARRLNKGAESARTNIENAQAKKRAAVAVARKLAVLLHRLWVTGEAYQALGYGRSEEQQLVSRSARMARKSFEGEFGPCKVQLGCTGSIGSRSRGPSWCSSRW